MAARRWSQSKSRRRAAWAGGAARVRAERSAGLGLRARELRVWARLDVAGCGWMWRDTTGSLGQTPGWMVALGSRGCCAYDHRGIYPPGRACSGCGGIRLDPWGRRPDGGAGGPRAVRARPRFVGRTTPPAHPTRSSPKSDAIPRCHVRGHAWQGLNRMGARHSDGRTAGSDRDPCGPERPSDLSDSVESRVYFIFVVCLKLCRFLSAVSRAGERKIQAEEAVGLFPPRLTSF
jgi:hypothetical protein